MGFRCGGCFLFLVAGLAQYSAAQHAAPSDGLTISGTNAVTWRAAATDIVLIDGSATIQTEVATMSARQAVVWISPFKGGLFDHRYVEIALIGDANLVQGNLIKRSGERLFVDATVRGRIHVQAQARVAEDQSDSDLYRSASVMRPGISQSPGEQRGAAEWLLKQPWIGPPTPGPSTGPTTQQVDRGEPMTLMAGNVQTTSQTADGHLAAVLSGRVWLVQRKRNGAMLEMLADRAVLFTPLRDLREVEKLRMGSIVDAVVGVYLEGDVQITQTPPPSKPRDAENRLLANRVYYDTTTDRAVLTDVVLHTYDFDKQLPVAIRAQKVRQLSLGEYEAQGARVSSSLFATPTYSLGASTMYIRQVDTGDPATGVQTTFTGHNVTLNLLDVPVFWLPWAAGVWNERGPLRNLGVGQSRQLGFGLETEWGPYELMGRLPPEGLDLALRLDWYSKRGPATGVDAYYVGDLTGDFLREPWSFKGNLSAYAVYDQGEDDLGRNRATIEPPSPWRGQLWWQHQHILPDQWQVQLTASYQSDPTYLETWDDDNFRTSRPRDISFYAKRQDQTEILTFLTTIQPNNFPTSSELAQEQIAGVERIPQIGYHRLGESLWDDSATLFSSNTIGILRFQESHASLEDQGYRVRATGRPQSPGLPSMATTGAPSRAVYRGDFREELALPLSVGQWRVVPSIMARATAYSDTPASSSLGSLWAGAALKAVTTYWKVDDTFRSGLLDLHRLRHVVEPEINLFYGARSYEPRDVFIYDEPIDAADDVGVVQLALHQRWQTKRGGAGRWRNVDVMTLNVECNWFFRRPDEERRAPADFRGILFPSLPEASIPRSGINADATWLVSDSTTLGAEAQYNADKGRLAAGSVALSVQHPPRLTWSVGFRYIGIDVDQVVNGADFLFESQKLVQFTASYQLTPRYRLDLAESYDFAGEGNVRSIISLTRRFDRFFLAISARVDRIGQENAVGFVIWPEGFRQRASTSALRSLLGP
jgi:lipopolysaccharide assembly outer membrane protein LptD (OstA)